MLFSIAAQAREIKYRKKIEFISKKPARRLMKWLGRGGSYIEEILYFLS